MKTKFTRILFSFSLLFPTFSSYAGVKSESSGLTLLKDGNARSAAVGQSFTAVKDDISAAVFNPSVVSTLRKNQASLYYQNGLADDSYGQFILGIPGRKYSAGINIGYYNGGEIHLADGSGQVRSVNAQRDYSAALSVGRKSSFGHIGMTGKYFSSTLIEKVKASAYAVDFGIQSSYSRRLNFGLAALNYGTPLQYVSEKTNLPRTLRGGFSYLLIPKGNLTSFMMDFPFLVNEKIWTPSIGFETLFGPLALRAGYKLMPGSGEFTMGTGFLFGQSSIDYAFGLINQFQSQHKLSLGMKFGGAPVVPILSPQSLPVIKEKKMKKVSSKNTLDKVSVRKPKPHLNSNPSQSVKIKLRKIYVVKPGDTLALIAKRELGSVYRWKEIYALNRHLIDDPANLEKQMKIILPSKEMK
ncbi:MAG: hypothetical protein ACKVQC_02285 [Elusimicrobiota bacterium]